MKNRLRLAPRPLDPEVVPLEELPASEAFDVFDLPDLSAMHVDEIRRACGSRQVRLKLSGFQRDAVARLSGRPPLSGLFSLSLDLSSRTEEDFQACVRLIENAPNLEFLQMIGVRFLHRTTCDEFSHALSYCSRLRDVFLCQLSGFEDALLAELARLPLRELRLTDSGFSQTCFERFQLRGRPPLRCNLIDLSDNPLQTAGFALIHMIDQSQISTGYRVSVLLHNCGIGNLFVECLLDCLDSREITLDTLDLSGNGLTSEIVPHISAYVAKRGIKRLILSQNKLDATSAALAALPGCDFVDLSENVISASSAALQLSDGTSNAGSAEMRVDFSRNLIIGPGGSGSAEAEAEQFADFDFPIVRAVCCLHSAAGVPAVTPEIALKTASQNLTFRQLEAIRIMREIARYEPFSHDFKKQIAGFADFPGILTHTFRVSPHADPSELDALFSAYLPLLPNLRMLDLSQQLESGNGTELYKICCAACRSGIFDLFDLSGIADGVILQALVNASSGYAVYYRMPISVSAFRVFYNLRMKGTNFPQLRYVEWESRDTVSGRDIEMLANEISKASPGSCVISPALVARVVTNVKEPDKAILYDLLERPEAYAQNKKDTVARVRVVLRQSERSPVEYNESTLQLTQMLPFYMKNSVYVSLFDNERDVMANKHSDFSELHLIFSGNGDEDQTNVKGATEKSSQSLAENLSSTSPSVDLAGEQDSKQRSQEIEPQADIALDIEQLRCGNEPSDDSSTGSVIRADYDVTQIQTDNFLSDKASECFLESASDYQTLASTLALAKSVKTVNFALPDDEETSLNETIASLQQKSECEPAAERRRSLIFSSSDRSLNDVLQKDIRIEALLKESSPKPLSEQTTYSSPSKATVMHVEESPQLSKQTLVNCEKIPMHDNIQSIQELLSLRSELEDKAEALKRRISKYKEVCEQHMAYNLRQLFADLLALKQEIVQQFVSQSTFGLELLFHPVFVQQPRFCEAWELLERNISLWDERSSDSEASKAGAGEIWQNENCMVILRNLSSLECIQLDTGKLTECFAVRVVQLLVLSDLRGTELAGISSFEAADTLFQRLKVSGVEEIILKVTEMRQIADCMGQACKDAVSEYRSVAKLVKQAKQLQDSIERLGEQCQRCDEAAALRKEEFDVIGFEAAEQRGKQMERQLALEQAALAKCKSQYVHEIELFRSIQERCAEFDREKLRELVVEAVGPGQASKIIRKLFGA